MSSLKSIIESIYNKDSDFIVLGLTGRTGSGCSTSAEILSAKINEMSHSLYVGDNPTSNEERKEKIVKLFFEHNWQPFQVIKVRSILTLMLAEEDIEKALTLIKSITPEIEGEKIKNALQNISDASSKIKASSDQEEIVNFYTEGVHGHCNDFRKILPSAKIVELYQKIGKNIRASGSPVEEDYSDGNFFRLAERINLIIKIIKNANKKIKKAPSW